MWPFSKKQPKAVPEATPEARAEKLLTTNEVFNAVAKSLIMNRSDVLMSGISGQNDKSDTLHNVYQDFGYPTSLNFFNFWNMYRRFGVARAVIEVPVDLAWVDNPEIKSDNETFVNQFKEICKKLKLWDRLKGLDKRQRVGRYAGMYFQIKDGKGPDIKAGSLNGVDSIVKLTLLYEGQLEVSEVGKDPSKEDYDQPTMYLYKSNGVGNRNEKAQSSFSIHPSRLVVTGEDSDDGTIYGIPALEAVFNDLIDLRKISGAGGEGFYQNTRMAPVFTANDDFTDDDNQEEDLADAIDEFLQKHRKRLVLRGIKAEYPNIQLSNPEEFYQATINNIAAGSKIPAAFLIGQQTGRLASDKDSRHLMTMVQSRRENYLTDVVKQVIDWFIDHNVLPRAEYEIDWGDLLTMSDNEKVEVVERMAAINEKQSRAGGYPVFDVSEMRERAGLDPEVEIDMPDESMEDDEEDPSLEIEDDDQDQEDES